MDKPRSETRRRDRNSLIRRAVSAIVAVLSPALLAGCLHTNRPVELAASDRSSPPVMNRAFLGHGRLVVEVDWLAGCAPNDGALAALRGWLARETARAPEEIDVHRGVEVSRGAGDGLGAISATVLANAHPPEDAYFVYVLYWDRYQRYRGVTFPGIELDARVDFPVVAMMADAIRHDSVLWMTRRKVESAVLVHEFGHVAGLVSSGRRVHDGHCPDPHCRMYHGPDWAAIKANAFPVLCLGKLPLDFCAACEAELAAGRK